MSFDIDITLRRGGRKIACRIESAHALVALFGPSGAGKSSVLDALAGLLRPERGRIAIAGALLFDSAAGIDLPPEQRGCGYVFQRGLLFPHRTVRQNLLFGRREGEQSALMTLDEAAQFLGIGDLLERMPASLSGGEAQRVAIGRALLSAPRFLLLDEPLASLDAERRDGIMRVIERIRDELRLPILYVSHDRAEVDRLAGEVVPLGAVDAR